MTLAVTGPRDVRDARRLAELEGVIQGGLERFVETGQALLEVRDSRLYRINYPTFEAYLKGRWNLERRHAYRLMEASEVAGALGDVTHGTQGLTERSARELAPVLREQGAEAVREVWAEAVDTNNGHPTAADVRAVVVGPGATRPKWNPGGAIMSSDTPEWYTPRHVVEAVARALGAIDLDPCAEAARSVPAGRHLTEEDDGLAQEWNGRVYMNPPYGRTIGDWTTKLRGEFDSGRVSEAIALVPARTETDWWESLGAEFVCFIHGRLAFSDGPASAPFPSAAVYLGSDGQNFVDTFAPLGPVYRRVAP